MYHRRLTRTHGTRRHIKIAVDIVRAAVCSSAAEAHSHHCGIKNRVKVSVYISIDSTTSRETASLRPPQDKSNSSESVQTHHKFRAIENQRAHFHRFRCSCGRKFCRINKSTIAPNAHKLIEQIRTILQRVNPHIYSSPSHALRDRNSSPKLFHQWSVWSPHSESEQQQVKEITPLWHSQISERTKSLDRIYQRSRENG